MDQPKPKPCGLLNINKPKGLTSRAVVDRVGKSFLRVKVGHAGTLDPLASGVLIVFVGAATRLVEYVQRMPKTYRTVVRLGARSDTLDANGQIVAEPNPRVASEAEARSALAAQEGAFAQTPPQYSALKVAGQRAYDLAREGRTVDLAARTVSVYRIDLLTYEWPRLEFEVACSGGTYIRSIARDLGETLGCGGLVEALTRTHIGSFSLADALDPQTLTESELASQLRPAAEAVAQLPRLQLSVAQRAAVFQGQPLPANQLAGGDVPAGEVALFGPEGELVAVAEHDTRTGRIWPRRVLAVR